MSTWRNLSKPQRAALRLFCDRGTLRIGPDLAERTFINLRDMGFAALPAGSRSEGRARWFPWGTEVVVTSKGREVVP